MDAKTHATILSSEIATDLIAKRLIRERNRDYKTAFDAVLRFLNPISLELMRHRKIRRGMLRPLVTSMIGDLQKHAAMVLLESRVPPRSISSEESYEVQFIQAANNAPSEQHVDYERWLDFVVCKIAVTRKQAELAVGPLNFRVNAHVLSRYMQRTRQPIETFFQDIVRPIRMSLVLAGHVAYMDKHEIAVPFANGMLLGSVNILNQPPARIVYKMNGKDGAKPPIQEDLPGLIPDGNVECCMRTFIEESGLNEQKTRLYESLLALERDERQGIEDIGRVYIFDENRGLFTAPKAVAAARKIVASSEWLAL